MNSIHYNVKDASLTDSTVIERPTQDLTMADIPPWLEQLISAQMKQQKMLMEEQAKQQEKILEVLMLKTQLQEDLFAKECQIPRDGY